MASYPTLDFDVSDLKNFVTSRIPVAIARYGDGEWSSILGYTGENCDGHQYFSDMGQELADIMRDEPYYFVGIHGTKILKDEVGEWLINNGVTKEFILNGFIHNSFKRGEHKDLYEVLMASEPIIVGNPRLEELKSQCFIPCPDKDSWLVKDVILRECELTADKLEGPQVFLIATGMPSVWIVDRLWRTFGDKHLFIDVGSFFDPFVGNPSRSFHKHY